MFTKIGRLLGLFPGVRITRLVLLLPSPLRGPHTTPQATTLERSGVARDCCPSLILGPGNLTIDRWDLAGGKAATGSTGILVL
jgi:hypothetical protein